MAGSQMQGPRRKNGSVGQPPVFRKVKAADAQLTQYVPSPRQRVITEYELLDSLIGAKTKEEIQKI